jgi:DNA repair protein RadA/Sms
MTTGLDYNRVSLLIAVLEKRAGFHLGKCDVFVNVAGGIKIMEPAADLGIVAAIASSYLNKPLDANAVFVGEVGLTGEIRSISHIEKRVSEAYRMGYTKCIVPEGNKKVLSAYIKKTEDKPGIVYCKNIKEVISKG